MIGRPTIDYVGRKFGQLTVLRRAKVPRIRSMTMWVVACSCGNEIETSSEYLSRGRLIDCGCVKRLHKNALDLTGQRFGKLIVLKQADEGSDEWGSVLWDCACDCGNMKKISAGFLRSKHTQSCGCWKHEVSVTHGLARKGKIAPEYRCWQHMKERCNNSKERQFKNYGGRGIKVCARWENSFESFFEDVGLRPNAKLSLDRINNNGDYEPGNVRWATAKQQQNNRRNNKRRS
jgi:hypothetical protein